MENQILPKSVGRPLIDSFHPCAGLIFGPLVLQLWSWLMVMHHFQNILQWRYVDLYIAELYSQYFYFHIWQFHFTLCPCFLNRCFLWPYKMLLLGWIMIEINGSLRYRCFVGFFPSWLKLPNELLSCIIMQNMTSLFLQKNVALVWKNFPYMIYRAWDCAGQF